MDMNTIGNIPQAEEGNVKESKLVIKAIGEEQLRKASEILKKYKAGKSRLEQKIIQNEQWWKLRHWEYIESGNINDEKTASAWLFNVVINKHADGIEAYPEPNILPRESGDKPEAEKLTSIIPCILEQNDFEETYSDVLWQKLKTGTGVYGVFWDSTKLNGLGDISIKKIDLLKIFWEPGITDIQDSKNVFTVELVDNDILEQQYPELQGKLKSKNITLSKYLYDDSVDTSDKSPVVDWYYHKYQNGRKVLHYCKYVNDTVLFATENETGEQDSAEYQNMPGLKETGWYEHGLYPFVFDKLFPTEGTPCGFGYIDVCRSAQQQIDEMNQAITKNARMAANPRFFVRGDAGSINESEFADWTKPFVHVNGNLGADTLKQFEFNPLSEIYIGILNNKITELRETSGNTEASTGSSVSGVTAASAIAALQEASGKTSRDGTLAAYRAYNRMIVQVIELIRQFYDFPRQFRIIGKMGAEQYISFDNSGIKPQAQGNDFGMDMGYRMPIFDIKVSAQKKNVYKKMQQNELALQLYGQGCFKPELTDQALMLLDIMDFDGKDAIMQKIQQNGTMYQQLRLYQQLALTLAAQFDPQTYQRLFSNIQQQSGIAPTGVNSKIPGVTKEIDNGESEVTKTAREQTNSAPMPG